MIFQPDSRALPTASHTTGQPFTPSLAQMLPEDLLHKIFMLLLVEARSALAVCTLVCRSWSMCGTPILLLTVHLRPQDFLTPPGPLTRPAVNFASFLRRKLWSSTHLAPCTPEPRRFSRDTFCTPRLVESLHELHVSATTVDFCVLQSVVAQLTNLRQLSIDIKSFAPLNPAKPYLRPQIRRSIDVLRLHRMNTVMPETSPESAPQLLDVLLWFYHCETLTIQSGGDLSGQYLANLLWREARAKSKDSRPTRVIIHQLRLGLFNAGICFGFAFAPIDVFDFRMLQYLSVRLCLSEIGLLNRFLSEYGATLHKFKSEFYPGDQPSHVTLAGLLPDGSEDLQRAMADTVQIFSTSCPKLQAADFTILGGLINSNLCRQLFHTYMKALSPLPSLKTLTIELFLMDVPGGVNTGVNGLETFDEASRHSFTTFISDLDWSLLDRQPRSPQDALEKQATTHTPLWSFENAPPPVDSISVSLGRYSYSSRQWVILRKAEQAKLVGPKVSTRTREILTFIERPFEDAMRRL